MGSIVFVSSRRIESYAWWPQNVNLVFDLMSRSRSTLTWVGRVIYRPMRLDNTNTVTLILCLCLNLLESYWQKRLLTSDDLRWPFEGSVTKYWTKITKKPQLLWSSLHQSDSMNIMKMRNISIFSHCFVMGRSRKWLHLRSKTFRIWDIPTCCRHRWSHHNPWVSSHSVVHFGLYDKVAKMPLEVRSLKVTWWRDHRWPGFEIFTLRPKSMTE